MNLPDALTLARIVRRVDQKARVLAAERLAGGVSAQVVRLTVAQADGSRRVLLLRWHAGRGQRIKREAQVLRQLHVAGLPVPQVVAEGMPGDPLPDGYILLEFIDGHTDFTPNNISAYLRSAAVTLARVHQMSVSAGLAGVLPDYGATCGEQVAQYPPVMDQALEEGRIRERLRVLWPWSQDNPACLLHGDYWPGNLIWRGGVLVGVIDWEDAVLGDPLADLANSRLEMLFAFGQAAMLDFTAAYVAHSPALDLRHLPHWELIAALRPMHQLATWAPGWAAYGRPDVTEHSLQAAHRWFVAQALARL